MQLQTILRYYPLFKKRESLITDLDKILYVVLLVASRTLAMTRVASYRVLSRNSLGTLSRIVPVVMTNIFNNVQYNGRW